MSKPQVSILITAWQEPETIGQAMETILNDYEGSFEFLLAIPDQETIDAAKAKAKQLGVENKVWISDFLENHEAKGKPAELNYLMDHAQGEYWIFTDGDLYFGDNVINNLIKHFENPQVMAVTGRPRSSDDINADAFAYYGHLLTDAAHHKRMIDLTDATEGYSRKLIKKRPFFPVSGYLFATRAHEHRAPEDCLVEDAYFSYVLYNDGGRIEYEPNAEVFVKFPKTLGDYFKQKKRSVGGYVQLWQYGVVKPETKTRSFWRELEYAWFPIRYAGNLKQLIWSLGLYPVRLWLWLKIFWERKIRKKSFFQTWVRIESTK